MDLNKKQHWFLLAFSVPVPGSWQPASLTVGVGSKLMTTQAMETARDQNGLPPKSVLTSVSYLGYASAHKMRGTRDEMRLTAPSEAFRQGMRAAALSAQGHPVSNPYLGSEIEDAKVLIQEWDAGFKEITDAHADAANALAAETTA